ncbi:MAG: M23 family metallopeptidase, partial [Clostridia bacterium]|nr:M23 family metallopeptidase [Clostridia bacterium]
NRAKLEMSKKKKEFETIAAELNLNSGELSEKYKEKNARLVEIKEKIKKLEEERKKYYSSTAKFIWPVKTSSYRVTSQYGWRGDPFGKPKTEYHKGIDIACSRGTPIIAVKDGVVTRAKWNGGYGECIIIYHGDGISSLYAHLDNSGKNGSLPYKGNNGKPTYHVKAGDAVKAGQVIGYVGTTGRSTGYHLHFGVIDTKTYTSLGGNYVNPNDYLPDGYYTKKNPKK